MASLCDKINAGFDICSVDPVAEGVEDLIFLFNMGDFVFTFDQDDPLVIIGIIPANPDAKLWRYTGTNNSFNYISKSVRTNVGPRYTEELDFNIAGNSSVIKGQIMNMGYGNLQAIVINSYKSTDAAFELLGAVNGLQDDGSERNPSDENFGGGWNIKLTNRGKLREPMPPRSISIPIAGTGLSGVPPLTNTAIKATGIPQNVAAIGSANGGSLAAATYYYKVVSVDGVGTTTGSAEVNVTTTGTTSSVALTWAGAPGATSYRVYRGTAAGAESLYYTTSTTNFTDTGAAGTNGTVPVANTAQKATAIPGSVTAQGSNTGGILPAATYYYVVTAVDAQGETLASTEVNAVLTGTTSSVLVEWAAAQGAVYYKVYRGTSAGGENIYFETSGLNFTDTGVTQPATYATTLAVLESLAA